MSKQYQILISALMVLFSLAAAVIGFAMVGSSDRSYPLRLALDFVFLMQFVFSASFVIAIFRKDRKSNAGRMDQ